MLIYCYCYLCRESPIGLMENKIEEAIKTSDVLFLEPIFRAGIRAA